MGIAALRIVLGDQLTPNLPLLREGDPARDVVLMAEVMAEARYVHHHKKKLIFIFSSMRAFAQELRAAGWQVDYVTLDDPANSGSLTGEVVRAAARHNPRQIVTMAAAEHRVLALQGEWASRAKCPLLCLDDPRFICSRDQFASWAKGRKTLRMEFFYREMRRKTGLLMEGDQPAGGRWNFDAENRKAPPGALLIPERLRFTPDAEVQAVKEMVDQRFPDHFGTSQHFEYPVKRPDAEAAAHCFMAHSLPLFGDFQDAMLRGHKFLFHSVLSPLINVGLLDPLALCRAAEAEWKAGRAPLNAVEGFIRQIIGWREYVRGIYWLRGADYVQSNALAARRPLPAMYWTGETRMACMAAAIGQTRDEAYAHHIQRLMVTGNFALLAGIDPHALHEWYLAVYMDAFEWVEAPNTIGMSQFADGGLLASKPYAASGAYINRMSDYCSSCAYRVAEKVGSTSCPLNALYWDFLARNRARLKGNPRLAQAYSTYDRIKTETRDAMTRRARDFLALIDAKGTDAG